MYRNNNNDNKKINSDNRKTITRNTRRGDVFSPPPLLLFFILLLLAVTCDCRSWDIAVVIGREIDFFARNQSLTGQAKIADAVYLTAIAYDDKTHTIFLGDERINSSIFSTDISQKNLTSKPLIMRDGKSLISGMAFDSRSRMLFWADSIKRLIMKVHVPINGPPETPMVLHNLSQTPSDIALDLCNGHVYWSSTEPSDDNSVIERSNFDGSNRTVIVNSNLYQPLGLAVDHSEGKLYWIDDVEGIHFNIERSNLDGTEREIIVHNRHQQPVDLAIDDEAIYWSDWGHKAIWTISKNVSADTTAVKFKSYHKSNRDADPVALITRDNSDTIDCAALRIKLEAKKKVVTSEMGRVSALMESYNNLTTSTESEDSESNTFTSNFCFNSGVYEKTVKSCRCKPGYSGKACEISLCHNYCFYGDCTINEKGIPTCECKGPYTGRRCERNPCENYCLNEGECTVHNSRPSCRCSSSFKGTRCEELAQVSELCAMFCASDLPSVVNVDVTSCRCENGNGTAEKMLTSLDESFEYSTLLAIFTALIVVLVVLIVVLSYYVNKLRRRPRIKKRFVVSKGGVTPLTSRPQIGGDNQCEITIENCCNMNICETPCFEPKLRTPAAKGSSNTKKEEKNSLLDNMENGGNSC